MFDCRHPSRTSGKPIDNNAVYLLDGQQQPVQMGQVGELYVAGKHVAGAYVNGRETERFSANTIDHRKSNFTF